jgi:DNA-binding CsgD family transcriptional regulator
MNNYKELVESFNAQHAEFVDALCAPLVKSFEIKNFGYRRFLPNGNSLGLHNNHRWYKHFCTHFLGNPISLYEKEVHNVSMNSGNLFFRAGSPDKNDSYEGHLHQKGLWNSFALYLKHPTSIEGFYFTTKANTAEGLNYYANQLDALNLFATHFSNKISSLMTGNQAQRLYHPTINKEYYTKKAQGKLPRALHDLLQSLEIEEFYLPVGRRNVLISLREFQCLFFMSKGQTFKEVGKTLALSPRTVESYINNLKSKTGAGSKSELIKLYFKSPYRHFSF